MIEFFGMALIQNITAVYRNPMIFPHGGALMHQPIDSYQARLRHPLVRGASAKLYALTEQACAAFVMGLPTF
jgi:hypothetical protein